MKECEPVIAAPDVGMMYTCPTCGEEWVSAEAEWVDYYIQYTTVEWERKSDKLK